MRDLGKTTIVVTWEEIDSILVMVDDARLRHLKMAKYLTDEIGINVIDKTPVEIVVLLSELERSSCYLQDASNHTDDAMQELEAASKRLSEIADRRKDGEQNA